MSWRVRSSIVLVLVLAAPAAALAQSSESIPVVANERPMRFVLTAGTVVIGTRVAEDAEMWTVQTQGGLVRIRKTDVAYMDFRTTEPTTTQAGAAVPVAAPVAAPPPPVQPRRRRGLLTAGISALAATYAITAAVGGIVSIWDADANWMFVPVAGPMIYYKAGDLDRDVFGLLLLSTIFQGAGMVAMIIGIVVYSNSGEQVAASRGAGMPALAFGPMLRGDARGLLVSLRL